MGKGKEETTNPHSPPDDLDDVVDALMQQSLAENDAVYRELADEGEAPI